MTFARRVVRRPRRRQRSIVMQPLGRFDTDLEMFVEEPRDPKISHLRFTRWLIITGRLDGDIRTDKPPPPRWGRRPRIPLLDYTGGAD